MDQRLVYRAKTANRRKDPGNSGVAKDQAQAQQTQKAKTEVRVTMLRSVVN
jgi:hypothetical protein